MKLKVLVNGGKFTRKEVVASLTSIDGRLSLRHSIYHTSEVLPVEWVSPKYPNPTRDNGLLVVIKGEHCGKYVRRIHHRYQDDVAIIILAVVTRAEDLPNVLTGEQLELEAEDLCVSLETKEEKKQNESVMAALREQARKTRAR